MRKRIFIVCGGPSVSGIDLSLLRDEDTMAVNYMAVHMDEPMYFLTADSGVISKAAVSGFWNLTKKTRTVVVINEYEHPRWRQVKDYVPKFDEHVVPTRWDGEISLDKKEFATGKNTGFCALQYAVHLGYKRIYLLGIDLKKTDSRKYFYTRDGGTESPYDLFYQHYVTGLDILKRNGVDVFSCSSISRLNKHIPYISFNKLFPADKERHR